MRVFTVISGLTCKHERISGSVLFCIDPFATFACFSTKEFFFPLTQLQKQLFFDLKQISNLASTIFFTLPLVFICINTLAQVVCAHPHCTGNSLATPSKNNSGDFFLPFHVKHNIVELLLPNGEVYNS